MKRLVAVACLLSCTAALAGPERWEPNIKAFEAADAKSPPPTGQVLFVGSSTIVGWNLTRCFPGLPALNRGFGGSTVADSVAFYERIIRPYRPRVIVFYAGGNDLAGGVSPRTVRDGVAALLRRVRADMPLTRFVWVPIKATAARWNLRPIEQQTNALVADLLSYDWESVVLDVDSYTLGADGLPRLDVLRPDKLHMNDLGYDLMSAALRPYLDYQVPTRLGLASGASTLR
ncbi:MAG: hypothetical protein HZB16_10705 [Armatimonadetes bacterium]|nr:hypothetical protein [Armatimonadota bacterium]